MSQLSKANGCPIAKIKPPPKPKTPRDPFALPIKQARKGQRRKARK